ncbi:MAG: insulinase family protein [Candidatus Brocadiaceae bacterium]|nr:insulinase family protein [Candidatus Brocadiaceae bacterium]
MAQGELRRSVLPNGLRVLGVENPSLHSFVCSVYVRVGPRFEPPERAGLSHFLEHMVLQGSERFPDSATILRGIEDVGGVVDAATYEEHMRFVFAVHRKHWRRVLEIAGDVLLRPLFDPGELEREKLIIAQEVSQHRDRAGRNISPEEIAHCLLFHGRASESGTRGSPAIMSRFDRALIEAHYRRFFVPGNMVVCLAGGLHFDEVLDELAERMGALAPAAETPPEPLPVAARPTARARAFCRPTEALPVAELLLSHRACGLRDERFDALRAASYLLGGGLSSRLFMRVREELGLVYQIDSHVQSYSDTGAFEMFLSVGVENLTAAFEAGLEVLHETLRDGFTAEELDRYKESLRCGMDMLCDQPTHLADWFGRQELLLGADGVVTPADHVGRNEALTLGDLRAVLRDVCTPDRSDLVCVGPYGSAEREGLMSAFDADAVAAVSGDDEPEATAPVPMGSV